MMMSDLPPDLIVEILCRVPAASLKQLRSTCKGWNALFKDQSFSGKHFRQAPKESLYLILKEYRLCSVSFDLNIVPSSIEFKDGVGLEDPHSNYSEQIDIREVFHCDGLLLCNTRDKRLVVWNPCSGENRWIQSPHDYNNITKRSTFALGYKNEKSCPSFKILRRWRQYYRSVVSVGSEIYDFNSNSWRVIEDMDTSYLLDFGVSLKGNTYWLAYKNISNVIICFDFTRERYKSLHLPLPHEKIHCKALSIVKEEQLSVLRIFTGSSKMEMWVTTNVDTEAELSWSRFFVVDLSTISKTVSVEASHVIDEEKNLALSYIRYHAGFQRSLVGIIGGDDIYFKTVPWIIDKQWPRCIMYVPSLLQIQNVRQQKITVQTN